MLWSAVFATSLVFPTLFPGEGEDPSELVRRAQSGAQRRLEEQLDLWPVHKTWDAPWTVRRGRFEVRSIHSYWLTNLVAQNLHAMDPHITSLLGVEPPKDRVLVIEVLENLNAYNQRGNELGDNRAAYHSSSLGSVYAKELPEQPVLTYEPANPEALVRWATHGAVHQWLDAAVRRPIPFWVEEGLCSYLSFYWDNQYGDRHFEPFRRMRRDRRTLDLPDLMRLPVESWQQQHYIQVAMAFHFLLNVCEDTCTYLDEDGEIIDAPFLTWLRDLLAGKSTADSVFQVEYLADLDLLAQEFANWEPPEN